jgi:methionyl-tRNA formyltransferase
VLRDLPASRNLLVFHSSDLPQGRGWAPLYHALAKGQAEHVVTALFAEAEVDAGDILAKARFHLLPCHTADNLRPIDEEVCIMLAAAILERYPDSLPAGVPQRGVGGFYARRSSADSEVDPRRSLADLAPHLRACGSSHRAFFDWQGCRYSIEITPEEVPGIPDDLHFEFADDIHFP